MIKILYFLTLNIVGICLISLSFWLNYFIIVNSKNFIPPFAFIGLAIPGAAGIFLMFFSWRMLLKANHDKTRNVR